MKTNKRCRLLLFLFILFCYLSYSYSDTSKFLEDILTENKDYLFKKMDYKPTKLKSVIEKLISTKDSVYSLSFELSRTASKEFVRLIESNPSFCSNDSIINKILITSLNDCNKYFVSGILQNIVKYIPALYIRKYGEVVKEFMFKNITMYNKRGDMKSRNYYLHIYTLLRLTENEKKTVLKCKNIPEYIKARLGNKRLEEKIINAFDTCSSYKEKAKYAEQLGYIGTESAIKSLIKNINSNVIDTIDFGPTHVYSIRCAILKALNYNFPNEEIFFNDLKEIIGKGETMYLYDKTYKPETKKDKIRAIIIRRNYWSGYTSREEMGLDYSVVKNILENIIGWAKLKYNIALSDTFNVPYIADLCTKRHPVDSSYFKRKRPVQKNAKPDTTKRYTFPAFRGQRPIHNNARPDSTNKQYITPEKKIFKMNQKPDKK